MCNAPLALAPRVMLCSSQEFNPLTLFACFPLSADKIVFLIAMESPNSEYRGRGGEAGGFEATNKMEQLSDQYKSMRELLKVYGLSVTEEMGNPQKGKLYSEKTIQICQLRNEGP